jgi:hypothetical protein
MGEHEQQTQGVITRFLAEDHRRLDALWQSAVADINAVDHVSYDRFRAGLLRHIGMEEKILLPAVQESRGGQPPPIAAKLRLDHGAIASLLMPAPSASIIAMLHEILTNHNQVEEGSAGLYEMSDAVIGKEAERILARLQAAPTVNVMPYSDSATVMNAVRRAVERAGYRFTE